MRVGIEKVSAYPGKLVLSFNELAKARGLDPDYFSKTFMAKARSINPPFEDPITLAVNAAKDFLTEEEKQQIGLLIVGTESGVDLEKTISSWVLKYLNLPTNCRMFEIKSACYCTTAALKMAEAWIRSGLAEGKKALIISSDISTRITEPVFEFVGGAAAVAMLVSDNPRFMEFEPYLSGMYAHEIADVIRPTQWLELTMKDQASLYSYMEALEGSYEHYKQQVLKHKHINPEFLKFFNYNVFHVPFPGISYRGFKLMMELHDPDRLPDLTVLFDEKTRPGIQVAEKLGVTYGASAYFCLLSLVHYAPDIKPLDRVGIFSYGSGSSAEFYSCLVGQDAKRAVAESNIISALDARTPCTVSQYEACALAQTNSAKNKDYKADLDFMGKDWFQKEYVDKNCLVLHEINDYYREYRWAKDE